MNVFMDFRQFTAKELEERGKAAEGTPDFADFLAMCRQDPRKAVQRIARHYDRLQKERERLAALYTFEHRAREEGYELVAGVDEAGRGPLAGPVSVAAVILPMDTFIPRLNDSKKVSPKVREELYDVIQEKAIAVGSALVDAKTIDRVNIYQATINGMYEAIFSLMPAPEKVLVDAVPLDNLPMPVEPIIKGDAKSANIAAASILAKVNRDRLMMSYDAMYPEYGFAAHKGYGTAEHIAALRKYGPCPIHRLSFEPVKSIAQAMGYKGSSDPADGSDGSGAEGNA